MLLVVLNATDQLSSRLGTYLSDKAGCDGERTVRYRERQRREAPRCRPEHDLGALPRVEFGIVTHAFQDVLVARLLLHPGGDRATGMGADDGIGDDAVGRARA